MSTPIDYRMCTQVITVYRKSAQGILRLEIPNCYLQWQEELRHSQLGRQQERKFLLIQPGETQLVFAGDRVFDGIGPQIDEIEWAAFLPVLVDRLGEVAYATEYRWQGEHCHTEAGRK